MCLKPPQPLVLGEDNNILYISTVGVTCDRLDENLTLTNHAGTGHLISTFKRRFSWWAVLSRTQNAVPHLAPMGHCTKIDHDLVYNIKDRRQRGSSS
jgi:hypothetical protein